MNERKPIHQGIYNGVLEDYHSEAGMTYQEMSNGIEAMYRDRVSRYMGEGVPCFTDEGAYITAEEKARRASFKKRMQSSGRLPKETK